MRGMFDKIATERDPMRLVREARERGVEPRLVSGYYLAGGGCIVVGWYIPDTNQIVIEGTVSP